ncbi:hypothetical protein [Geosporobacter ferrireducens]|uniref:hypothetical protein n=1 Tax=Geosporobacter ferrireducens TaxID=1424294 RepID=UPI00139BB562|nr:hypothetical protein [Geosporobacter ferrireducens]MTI56167.1 hypothetical protein [Geosporobacter ferrireducens]
MQYTGNYGLKKPDGADVVNVQDINDNMDILDTTVKTLADTMQDGAVSEAVGQINNKIGTNTDAGGTLTVFARLKQIYDHLASVLSSSRAAKIDNLDTIVSSRASQTSLDNVNTKVGVNTDTGGTTTVFARLKQIYDYLTGTVVTRIGTNTDAAGTTTIFARLRQIYDTVVANSLVQPTKPKGANLSVVAASVVDGAYYDIVNVSGSGKLLAIQLFYYHWNAHYDASGIRTIIDGVTTDHNFTDISKSGASMVGQDSNGYGEYYVLICDVRFKTSCRVQIKGIANNAIRANVNYSLV